MRVAVCDDEEIFLECIRELMEQEEKVASIECFAEAPKLLQEVREGKEYDLIFMDIELKNNSENGIFYAASINRCSPQVQIIFITSYNDRYSQDIFFQEVNLCGYLVKPIQPGNLHRLLEKAEHKKKALQNEKLVLKTQNGTEVFNYKDILYLESRGHRIVLYDKKHQEIPFYGKLDEYEEKTKGAFLRIHQSYLVNMKAVKRLNRTEIVLEGEIALPISKAKYTGVKEKYFTYVRSEL